QRTQPWQLAKDASRKAEVDGALYAGLEAVRIAGYLLYPYMPNLSARVCEQLGVAAPDRATWTDVARWGALVAGAPIKTAHRSSRVSSAPRPDRSRRRDRRARAPGRPAFRRGRRRGDRARER